MVNSLRQRLLRDIAELQTHPYPNITLHVHDQHINKACLILDVESYNIPMHLTVGFPSNYPLHPPSIRMDSNVQHPNIFNSYICASILNTADGYTPAYTLKSIAIQLLSFFSSDKVTQSGGLYSIDLAKYRERQQNVLDTFTCDKCRFGMHAGYSTSLAAFLPDLDSLAVAPSAEISGDQSSSIALVRGGRKLDFPFSKARIPDILLLIMEQLETEDLLAFAQAWERVAWLMNKFDVIRTRELQCFCLKKDYREVILGVGVDAQKKSLSSEFDLLSREGFDTHRMRRSTQGLQFTHWLPLPISYRHWRKASSFVETSLSSLANSPYLGNVPQDKIIYAFMSDIVVKLNEASDKIPQAPYMYEETKSTLTHASEKAIESYFHLFHLLLCLAIDNPSMIDSANNTLRNFNDGKTQKSHVPNLGHLLAAALIADDNVTGMVMIKKVIKEAVTRNVVWMLTDNKGLAYLEPSPVSEYRLQRTFQASKTSYRLLMFQNLFRHTATLLPPTSAPTQPLTHIHKLSLLRDLAFSRHGAPPRGIARELARAITRIHQINDFSGFLREMGVGRPGPGGVEAEVEVEMPSKQSWTAFLRDRIRDSMREGYSSWGTLSQGQALAIRRRVEPGVERAVGVEEEEGGGEGMVSFRPQGGGGRGRGERGRGWRRGGR